MSQVQVRSGWNWRLVGSLARADGPRLIKNYWFGAGVALALLGSSLFIRAALGEEFATWHVDAWTVVAGFLLMSLFVMIAANAATLRDDHGNATEQHQTLPTSGETRALGLAVAVAWPAAGACLLLGSIMAISNLVGVPPNDVAITLAHYGAQVLMMGSLGIALGSWLRSSFVAPVLAFAMYLVHPGETPVAWHTLWYFASPQSTVLVLWHVAYLFGLTVTLVAVAQSKWVIGRSQIVALICGLALAVSAATVLVAQGCPDTGVCSL